MLIELPNGRWVRLSDISSIEVMVSDDSRPRVLVHLVSPHYTTIHFDTHITSVIWAREFAHKVNTALLIDQVAKVQTNA